jgi:hypothetical protein
VVPLPFSGFVLATQLMGAASPASSTFGAPTRGPFAGL